MAVQLRAHWRKSVHYISFGALPLVEDPTQGIHNLRFWILKPTASITQIDYRKIKEIFLMLFESTACAIIKVLYLK
ncbi:hypothetical protein RRG08_041206 [Elysia crispata]|uniref:Uncharacterized protein n=1 Tax=Elysia crispata TaxID=231223 RepID=A0AAE1B821_9GAST|nr:hypothetical protein RRG08_041206 [Elysia crispata]